jgi:lysine-specific demethylase/histidyl-hydroxylase NO66
VFTANAAKCAYSDPRSGTWPKGRDSLRSKNNRNAKRWEIPLLDTSRMRFAALSGLLGSAATVERFFDHHWEQCPLLIKDAHWPRDLLTSERIEDLISFRQHGTEVVLARTWLDGRTERSVFNARRSTDASDICQAWYEGSTIIITALHLRDARVALFIQQLEADFQHGVGANLYFTPEGNQGFKTHTDDHDVFVLQLEGRKSWTIYDLAHPGQRPPLRHAPAFPMQLVLEQEQALYIPKGYPHFAATEGSSSTHLTVGLYPFQLSELVSRSLVEVARDYPQWRLSLSPVNCNLREQIPPAMMAKLFEDRYLAKARKAMMRDFLQHAKPFIPGRLSQNPSAIGLDTCLRSQFFGLTLVETRGGHASIQFPGNQVSGPAVLEPAFQFVSEHESLCPRDLPDELHDSTKVVLAQRPAREGLLALDEEENGNG